MENLNLTITPVAAAVQNLSACRANAVKAAGKTGEVIKAYAVAMFDIWGFDAVTVNPSRLHTTMAIIIQPSVAKPQHR